MLSGFPFIFFTAQYQTATMNILKTNGAWPVIGTIISTTTVLLAALHQQGDR